MSIYLYENDLPSDLVLSGDLAIDTETMGLDLHRDNLCLIQISTGDGNAHLVLDIDLDKQQQASDWGTDSLSEKQQIYAANDVLYLHKLRDILKSRLTRENRLEIAQACFDFLPSRVALDLEGWPEHDIFAHL